MHATSLVDAVLQLAAQGAGRQVFAQQTGDGCEPLGIGGIGGRDAEFADETLVDGAGKRCQFEDRLEVSPK